MDAPVVRLGKHEAKLVHPSPLMAVALLRTKEEVQVMDAGEMWALGAAALYACWPKDVTWPVQPRPRPWTPAKKAVVYGHEIFDQLAAEYNVRTLFPVLTAALTWASLSVVTEEEVAGAENF